MRLKNKIRSIAVASAVAIVAITGAGSASATSGGRLVNEPESNGVVYVTNDSTPDQASKFYTLYPGWDADSRIWAGFNVTGFKVPYHCKAKSQYSGSSWPYVGTVVYKYSSNNLVLAITVYCW